LTIAAGRTILSAAFRKEGPMKSVTPVLAALLLAAASMTCASADSESWLIPESREVQMGAEYNAQLLQEMPAYTGAAQVTNYINAMGQALVPNSGRPNLAYHFTVVDTDEINAFAVMGGYVYVTTGLLKTATSGAEVATILAHELGHISARHGVRAMETYIVEQGLTDLLLKDGQTKDIVTGALGTLTSLTFSKDQEREADTLGIRYAASTGWNPWAMVDFFQYLEQAGGGTSSGGILSQIGEMFSTHPSNPERVQNATTELDGMGIAKDQAGYRYGLPSEDPGFASMKAILGG